jgi:hypothetical protein
MNAMFDLINIGGLLVLRTTDCQIVPGRGLVLGLGLGLRLGLRIRVWVWVWVRVRVKD